MKMEAISGLEMLAEKVALFPRKTSPLRKTVRRLLGRDVDEYYGSRLRLFEGSPNNVYGRFHLEYTQLKGNPKPPVNIVPFPPSIEDRDEILDFFNSEATTRYDDTGEKMAERFGVSSPRTFVKQGVRIYRLPDALFRKS